MGEYEDRYPDAYGRDEPPAPQPQEHKEAPPRQPAQQGRDRPWLRSLFGGAAPSEAAPPPAWQHSPREPAESEPAQREPVSSTGTASRPSEPNYRGVAPRGYVRSSTRIYEDICDRLTDHPLIDASDIEVVISGIEVTLRGSIDNAIAAGRAEAVARGVPGVKSVRNTLKVRARDPASQR